MRISFQWLQEFVKLPKDISPNEIAQHLTLAGLEVESIERLESGDHVLEIGVTPNRPDALSHIGIAREIAAILQIPVHFTAPSCKETAPSSHELAEVTINAKEACLRYSCRIIEGIVVGESPDWLKDRLVACGMRPVNNVVDASNYVMLGRGQPTHPFDYDRVGRENGRAHVYVRHAEAGETLTALGGQELKLVPEDLVIADNNQPLALAGVIGGAASEVHNKTKIVLLESAYFDPKIVRRMSRRHGFSTEASFRFERGSDPNGVVSALDEAANLIVQLAGGRVRRNLIDVYHRKVLPLEVPLRMKRAIEISALPEHEIDEVVLRNRFLALGIETVGPRGDALVFRIPTFRPDLTREIDLIEELMRLTGYDKVPLDMSFSRGSISELHDEKLDFAIHGFTETLMGLGFCEAMNFSFGSPVTYKAFATPDDPELIRVKNPLGEDMSAMRQMLVPGLLENVSTNSRMGIPDIRLYEVGTVFLGINEAKHDIFAREHLHFGAVMTGRESMLAYDAKSREVDFYDLKGALEECLRALNLRVGLLDTQIIFRHVGEKYPFMHPGSAASVILKIDDRGDELEIGVIGELHPSLKDKYEVKTPLFLFEIDLNNLKQTISNNVKMTALPRYPSVKRDLALLVPEELEGGAIVGFIASDQEIASLIESANIFDVYQGKGIADGKKSVGLTLTLRSKERTLTDDEVTKVMSSLSSSLQNAFQAQVR